MDASHGLVRCLQHGHIALIRIEGRVNLSHSPGVRSFGLRWLQEPEHLLVFDLRQCRHMDSTFVGTLLFLQRHVEEGGRGTLILAAPSEECLRILGDMGVNEAFRVEEKEVLTPGNWTVLELDKAAQMQVRGCIVDAHRALASTPGRAGEQFLRVAECFRDDDQKPV